MLGRFLFRRRGVIGVLTFGVVFWLAKPTFGSCFLGLPSLLAGVAVRFWASGYIGMEGRVREIGARERLAIGPYRVLRHPLYIGNFLLVVGMLLALRPALWLSAVVLVGFVAEYGLIVAAEEGDMAARRRQRSEGRGQNAEARMTEGALLDRDRRGPGREATGERFGLRRALCEWRTWVVTGAAWGLAVVRAALRAN